MWLRGVYSIVEGTRQTHNQHPVINSNSQSCKLNDRGRQPARGRGRSLHFGHRAPLLPGDVVSVSLTSRHTSHRILKGLSVTRKSLGSRVSTAVLEFHACCLLTGWLWASNFLSSVSSFMKDLYLWWCARTGDVCRMSLLSGVVHSNATLLTMSSHYSGQFIVSSLNS